MYIHIHIIRIKEIFAKMSTINFSLFHALLPLVLLSMPNIFMIHSSSEQNHIKRDIYSILTLLVLISREAIDYSVSFLNIFHNYFYTSLIFRLVSLTNLNTLVHVLTSPVSIHMFNKCACLP